MPAKVFNKMSLHDEVNPDSGEGHPTIIGNLPVQSDITDDDVRNAALQTPQVTRELTQTDRINKHLLKSFLDRINASGHFMEHFSSNATPQTSAMTVRDNDDFEEQLFIGTQIM